MRLLWVCALVAALSGTAPPAWAQPSEPLVLDALRGSVALVGRLDVLEDPQGQLPLQDARTSSAWRTLPGKLDAGFTPSTFWVRLTVRQPTPSTGEWVLSVDSTQLDEVVFHAPSDLAAGRAQRAGRLVPHAQWPLDSRTPAFRVQLPPGEHQLYLRMRSEHTLSNDIFLRSADAFRLADRRESLIFGALLGAQAVVLLLQWLFGHTAGKAIGALYMLYTLALGLVALLSSGYLQAFVVTHVALPVQLITLAVVCALLVWVRMSIVWLKLDSTWPSFTRWYQAGMVVGGLLAAGLTLTRGGRDSFQLIQGLFAANTLLSLGWSLHLWRQGSVRAMSYVLIFGLLDLGCGIRFARNSGWLPINTFTDYAIFIGISTHLIAMSVYFIVRFRNMAQALLIEQQARAEQREFVGMVSHEFKTPLAIIHTSIQQLSANLDAPREKILQRADNIRNAVRRMDRLLDEYLSVERLDTAHQPMRMVPTDFFEVVEEAVCDWPLEAIQWQVDALPDPIVCDPDQMRIVLRNLLENAVRHSPDGTPVALAVRRLPDRSLQISVANRGEGIPPEELPRLFQKFFRGKAAQGSPGAGLGLYLVERIVRAHHGKVQVESTAGHGTCFTVHLPARA